MNQGDQQALLSDPWAFKEFLFSIPIHAAFSQREALLHLVFPDTFEDIISRDYKRRIVEAFRQELPEPENDVDRALLAIRRKLQNQHGGRINFHERGFVEKWQPPDRLPSEPEEGSVPPGASLLAVANDVSADLLKALSQRFATTFATGVVTLGAGITQRFDLVGANGAVGANPDRDRVRSPTEAWKAISEAVWLLQLVDEPGPRFVAFIRERRLPRNWLDHYGGPLRGHRLLLPRWPPAHRLAGCELAASAASRD